VLETIQETGERVGAATLLACQPSTAPESLGCRVVKAEIDGGRA
jgi:hypothetical protein